MSRISDEAKEFIHAVLFARQTPTAIKTALAQELSSMTTRETSLRAFIATARNTANAPAIRIAALREIVRFFRGDL